MDGKTEMKPIIAVIPLMVGLALGVVVFGFTPAFDNMMKSIDDIPSIGSSYPVDSYCDYVSISFEVQKIPRGYSVEDKLKVSEWFDSNFGKEYEVYFDNSHSNYHQDKFLDIVREKTDPEILKVEQVSKYPNPDDTYIWIPKYDSDCIERSVEKNFQNWYAISWFKFVWDGDLKLSGDGLEELYRSEDGVGKVVNDFSKKYGGQWMEKVEVREKFRKHVEELTGTIITWEIISKEVVKDEVKPDLTRRPGDPICGAGTQIVGGICQVIRSTP